MGFVQFHIGGRKSQIEYPKDPTVYEKTILHHKLK